VFAAARQKDRRGPGSTPTPPKGLPRKATVTHDQLTTWRA